MPQERRAMAMRMRAMSPKLTNPNTFEIVANNPQIAQYLLNLKDNILKTMRKNLCNTDIYMNVRIADIQEVRHITSKSALYQMMVERNKNVQRLAEMLKLEICK
jgi:hypothetical protein